MKKISLFRIVFFNFFYIFTSKLQAETYQIRPKAYLDTESGKLIYQKVIVIKDGKIFSINDSSSILNKDILEFPNLYLLPGLVDCHSHIFFTQLVEDQTFEKALVRELKITDKYRTDRAKIFLKQYLAEGFTSVCDLGNSGNFLDAKLKLQIAKDYNYPDIFISGPGIATNKGQFFSNTADELVRSEYLILNSKTDIDKQLANYINNDVDILKVYMDNSPGVGAMTDEQVEKILKSPYANKFKKITFHAIEKDSIEKLIKYNHINMEHGSSSDWTNVTNGKNISLTLTDLTKDILSEFNYYQKTIYLFQIHRAQLAYKKGIRLIFGPDFYFHKNDIKFNRAKYVKKTLEVWKESGISPLDIIKAMTINASTSLKMNNLFGVIKVGARANLIGVSENPLNNINSLFDISLLINKGNILKSPRQSKP